MLEYPFCIYNKSFPAGSIRRVFIGVSTAILMLVGLMLFARWAPGIPGARWFFPVVPALIFFAGKKLIQQKPAPNLKTLRFNWNSDRFQYEDQNLKISFLRDETIFLKASNGEVWFMAKNHEICFPESVSSAGNFLTGFYMNRNGRSFGLRLTFESGKLSVLPL